MLKSDWCVLCGRDKDGVVSDDPDWEKHVAIRQMVVNPETRKGWDGKDMDRAIISHLAAVSRKIHGAIGQTEFFEENDGAQHMHHNPVRIIQDELAEALQVMSFVPRMLEELTKET